MNLSSLSVQYEGSEYSFYYTFNPFNDYLYLMGNGGIDYQVKDIAINSAIRKLKLDDANERFFDISYVHIPIDFTIDNVVEAVNYVNPLELRLSEVKVPEVAKMSQKGWNNYLVRHFYNNN